MAFYAYMLASKPNGTIYIGQTDSLTVRTWQHKTKVRPGFTAKYDVDRLVWFSIHDTRAGAKAREATLKKWNRAWKIKVIEAFNPTWKDLYEDFLAGHVTAFNGPLPERPPE
ncbi:MAG: GIY-YIG nuclease family protein [Caulobacter sp.]|nr:GIY-YIG nuclease family protein [Caulobacter sp.]